MRYRWSTDKIGTIWRLCTTKLVLQWTHDQYAGKVFVFAPFGVLGACDLNTSESINDCVSADWGGINRKLEMVYNQCGARFDVDLLFSKGAL